MMTKGRQATIDVPGPIVTVAEQLARDQAWSFEQALVVLLRWGVDRHQARTEELTTKYNAMMAGQTAEEQETAGDELMLAIFGPEQTLDPRMAL
jgi:hypothetical protein